MYQISLREKQRDKKEKKRKEKTQLNGVLKTAAVIKYSILSQPPLELCTWLMTRPFSLIARGRNTSHALLYLPLTWDGASSDKSTVIEGRGQTRYVKGSQQGIFPSHHVLLSLPVSLSFSRYLSFLSASVCLALSHSFAPHSSLPL